MRFFVAVTICFLLCPISVPGLEREKKVRFVTEHWPPYNYVDEQGEIIGISVFRIQMALKLLNWESNIELYHWAKAVQITENHPGTFLFSIYPTQERLPRYQWICPLVKTEPASFFRLSSRKDIEVETIEDTKRYVSGVIRHGVGHSSLLNQGFKEDENLYLSLDDDTLLNQLLHRRIDFVVDERHGLDYRLDNLRMPRDTVTMVMPIDNAKSKELCIATNLKTDPKVVEALRQAILSLL